MDARLAYEYSHMCAWRTHAHLRLTCIIANVGAHPILMRTFAGLEMRHVRMEDACAPTFGLQDFTLGLRLFVYWCKRITSRTDDKETTFMPSML